MKKGSGINKITPLMSAAGAGNEDITRMLLRSGADVNASTEIDDDSTPLMAAAERGHTSMVEILVANGADRHALDRWGRTAADIAAKSGHDGVAEMLRR